MKTNLYFVKKFALLLLMQTFIVSGQVTVNLSRHKYDYDLGTNTSPVRTGWNRISPQTTGDIFWSVPPAAIDRGASGGVNEINQDFVTSDAEITFSHKIANDEWTVTMNMGDVTTAHDSMKVIAEGVVLTPATNSGIGNYPYVVGVVTVTDGELNIVLSDIGGTDPSWVWNRLSLSREPDSSTIGTMRDHNGKIIRACPRTFGKTYPGPTRQIQKLSEWYEIKDHHYNAVRLTWTGALRSTDPNRDVWEWGELLNELDIIAANAVAADMTLIINYHHVGEQDTKGHPVPDYTMNWLEAFWDTVAPRYKDNQHVVYELQNEPTFSLSGFLKPEFKNRFLEIYNMVRQKAPQRQIIVFDAPHHSYINELVMAYEDDLDWDYTVGAYHLYGGGNSNNIKTAASRHRVICSEWDYSFNNLSYVRPVDGYTEGSETLERINQGWMDWSTHDCSGVTHGVLIPDALAKGYEWWENTGTLITWDYPNTSDIYYEGADVGVKVSATDDGSVAACRLFLNGILVSEDLSAPYEWTDPELKNMAPGNYILRVEVEDNEGNIEPSTRDFSVLPGTINEMVLLNPLEDAFVRNDGTQDGTGNRLISKQSQTSTEKSKPYLKFDLSGLGTSKVGSAKLRLYNTGEGDDGFLYMQELLNDSWTETGINFGNAPLNTSIPGQLREDRGGETAADIQFCALNEWTEYDVTLFINQELAGNDIVTFQPHNQHESQERYKNRNHTEEAFYFGSRESTYAPQLILAEVGVSDTMPVSGVTVSPSSAYLFAEQTITLKADIVPANAQNKTISWSSNDPLIATVSNDGSVTAISDGIATITATTSEGNFKATSKVTVFSNSSRLSTKPVAYWPFDETSGGIARDKINDANAIWQNGSSTNLSWVKGLAGNAADLIGGGNDKFIVSSDPLNGSSELTISAWVNMKAFGGYKGVITTRNFPTNTLLNWGIAVESSHIDARWNGDAIDSEEGAVNIGVWQHILMTWKSTGERSLYLDGKLVKTDTSVTNSYTTGGSWWIGDDPCCSDREIKAQIDEISMFDTALSVSDIILIYGNGLNNKSLDNLITPWIGITGIQLTPDTLTLKQGESGKITTLLTPMNASDTSVTWSIGDQSIADLDKGMVLGKKPGKTYVKATTNDAKLSDSCLVIVTDSSNTNGLIDRSSSELLRVYPNPASDVLNIELTTRSPLKVALSLYSILGKQIRTKGILNTSSGFNKIEFGLNELPSGIYILEIKMDKQILTQRIIVEKK